MNFRPNKMPNKMPIFDYRYAEVKIEATDSNETNES